MNVGVERAFALNFKPGNGSWTHRERRKKRLKKAHKKFCVLWIKKRNKRKSRLLLERWVASTAHKSTTSNATNEHSHQHCIILTLVEHLVKFWALERALTWTAAAAVWPAVTVCARPPVPACSARASCRSGRHICPCSGSWESTVEVSEQKWRCRRWRGSVASKTSIQLNEFEHLFAVTQMNYGRTREKDKEKNHDLSHEKKASSGQCRRVETIELLLESFFLIFSRFSCVWRW